MIKKIKKLDALKLMAEEYNYTWPEDLWTGVIFYYGHRITVEEFNEYVNRSTEEIENEI